MTKLWFCFSAVAVLSCPAWAQRVQVQKPDRAQIFHIQTALNHLTVLEMTEPVSTVAVGSPLFKVEWRENKVFIEPTETNVATNLFVWTASGRFNYELDPAGAIPQMDFAIDQPAIDPPLASVSPVRAVKPSEPSQMETRREAKPVHSYGPIPEKDRVAVYLTDLLEHDGQVFIQYTIRNKTARAYVPGTPQVIALNTPCDRGSLQSLSNSQPNPGDAARLKCIGETNVEVAKGEIPASRIEPGQETTGIVVVKLPPQHARPTALRFVFFADPNGPISATVEL